MLALAVAGCGGGDSAVPEEEEPLVTYFNNGHLLIGDGSEVIRDAALVVNDGIITDFGPRADVSYPPGADSYDLSDHTMIPFLTNVHGHAGYARGTTYGTDNYSVQSAQIDLNRYLYYGVGAVALMGTDINGVGNEIKTMHEGSLEPHVIVYTGGRGITARGGFPTTVAGLEDMPYEVSSEAEARAAVEELASLDVDFVKIWVDDNRRGIRRVFRFAREVTEYGTDPKLSPALFGAIIDEATQAGIPVVAHVKTLADAKALVAAGVSGLLHSIRDRAVDQELIDAMLANDVFFTPTLARHQIDFVFGDEPDWLREPALRESAPGAMLSRLTSSAIVRDYGENLNDADRRREFETAMSNFKTFYDAGIRMGLGSDAGATNTFPGYFEHLEMELMVEAGLTPLESLRLGIEASAAILGADEMGPIEVGKPGHFLIVPGDPSADISESRNIAEVFYRGELIDRSTMMVDFRN
jgi:imidazolonepropionase-like amidohydrolase